MPTGIYKRKPCSEETKRKISNKLMGHEVSLVTREKLKVKLKGRKISEETRNKLRHKVPWNKGLKGFRKGYKQLEEHKKKIGNANRTHGLSNDKKWKKQYNKKYYGDNKKKERKRTSKYAKENRYSVNENQKRYYKKRYKKDIKFKILLLLRGRVSQAFKRYAKQGKVKSSRQYGINYEKIIEHLKPFPKNTSKYHIDHIKPLCSFDLTNPKEK